MKKITKMEHVALPLPYPDRQPAKWGVYQVRWDRLDPIAFCYNDYTANYLAALLNAAEIKERKGKPQARARRKEGAK